MKRDFHPVAELFPLLGGNEFDGLVKDVREHGLREPIWLHQDGRIIDGRNRYLACLEAGIEPPQRGAVQEKPGVDPMNAPYPFQLSPRCTATSKRTGQRCRAPAVNGWRDTEKGCVGCMAPESLNCESGY